MWLIRVEERKARVQTEDTECDPTEVEELACKVRDNRRRPTHLGATSDIACGKGLARRVLEVSVHPPENSGTPASVHGVRAASRVK